MALETSIEDLPDGILTKIFESKQLRSLEELMTLSCVCKRWRNAALQTRYLSVESKYLEESETALTKVLLLDLLARYASLEEVGFDVAELDAPFLWAFLRGRDRLTTFTFEGAGRIDVNDSAALLLMLRALPSLRQLMVEGLILSEGVIEQTARRRFTCLQQIKLSDLAVSPAGLDALMSCCPNLKNLSLTPATVEGDTAPNLFICSSSLEELEFRLARKTVGLYIETPSLKSATLGLNNNGSAHFVAHQLTSLKLHACKSITTAGTFSGVKKLTWSTAWGPKGVVSVSWSSLIGLLDQMSGLKFFDLSCNKVSVAATDAPANISRFFKGLSNLLEFHISGDWFFRMLAEAPPLVEGAIQLVTLDMEVPDPLPPHFVSHCNWLMRSSPNLKYVTILTDSEDETLTRSITAYRKEHPHVQVQLEQWTSDA